MEATGKEGGSDGNDLFLATYDNSGCLMERAMKKLPAIEVGASVVYVPEQNKGENIHHEAKVLARAKRANFYKIQTHLGVKRVHAKRLMVGQVDAFTAEEDRRFGQPHFGHETESVG